MFYQEMQQGDGNGSRPDVRDALAGQRAGAKVCLASGDSTAVVPCHSLCLPRTCFRADANQQRVNGCFSLHCAPIGAATERFSHLRCATSMRSHASPAIPPTAG